MMIDVGDKGGYIIYYEASSRLSHDETLFFLCFFPVNLLSHVCSVLSSSGMRRKRLIECPDYWNAVIREWDRSSCHLYVASHSQIKLSVSRITSYHMYLYLKNLTPCKL